MIQLLAIVGGALVSVVSAAALGRLIAPRTPLPLSVRFITGAAALSLLIFALLSCHLGYASVYLCGAIVAAVCAARTKTSAPSAPGKTSAAWWLLFGCIAILYFFVALAPEIEEDAAGYHLRIVADYVRLHTFSSRVAFYDVLPHGFEMLFVPAFSFGAHSAAKLVHFAFLLATVPLIRQIAREAGIGDNAGWAAALLFFLAPVAAVDGTSAYTDVGLTCAVSATLFLLLKWQRERSPALLACAALNAGFAYSIKPTFGWVAVAAVAYVAVSARRWRTTAAFAAVAAATVLPWIARAWFLTGDPFAPFLNAWFPNSASTIAVEKHLLDLYSPFRPSFAWRSALMDYIVKGGNQGTFGVAFLLLPLALFALRKKAGRTLLAASLLLAVPFTANTGARFLMPSLIPASIALASVLPAPLLPVLVAIQAIDSLPPLRDRYRKRPDWSIREIPVRAALRIEPEPHYLKRSIQTYPLTTMLAADTPAGSRIFSCTPLPESYLSRQILFYWQSALAAQFTDALHLALMSHGSEARMVSMRAPNDTTRFIRITASSEFRLMGASATPPPAWPLYRPGNFLTFPAPTGADLLMWPADVLIEKTEARSGDRPWTAADFPALRSTLTIDIRRDVTGWMRRAGYGYILIPLNDSAFGPIGMDMARHPAEWGVTEVERSGNHWLFYILPGI